MINSAQSRNSELSFNSAFTAIPQELINSTTWQNLSGNAIKVYMTLRSYSNGEYKPCWPGISRLITHTGLSRNTLIKCLRELETFGLIETVQQNNRSNLYKFIFQYDQTETFPAEENAIQLSISDSSGSFSDTSMSNSDNRIQILNSNKKQEQKTRTRDKQQNNNINNNVGAVVNDNHKTDHEIVEIEKEVKSKLDIDHVKSFSKKTGIQYHVLIWLLYKYKVSSERLKILELALDREKHRIKNKGGFIRRAIEEEWPFQEIANELNRKQKAKEHKLKQKQKCKQEQMKEVERKKKDEQIDRHRNEVLTRFKKQEPHNFQEFKQEIQQDIFSSLGLKEGVLFEKVCTGRLYEKACLKMGIKPLKE